MIDLKKSQMMSILKIKKKGICRHVCSCSNAMRARVFYSLTCVCVSCWNAVSLEFVEEFIGALVWHVNTCVHVLVWHVILSCFMTCCMGLSWTKDWTFVHCLHYTLSLFVKNIEHNLHAMRLNIFVWKWRNHTQQTPYKQYGINRILL